MIVNSDNPSQWMASGPGARRRILCESPDLMMVAFRFEAGGEGLRHNHPHEQSTYVQSGRFRFTIDGVTRVLRAGDATMMPANAYHSCICEEAGILIDAFTPRREDFLQAHDWAKA